MRILGHKSSNLFANIDLTIETHVKKSKRGEEHTTHRSLRRNCTPLIEVILRLAMVVLLGYVIVALLRDVKPVDYKENVRLSVDLQDRLVSIHNQLVCITNELHNAEIDVENLGKRAGEVRIEEPKSIICKCDCASKVVDEAMATVPQNGDTEEGVVNEH